MKMPFLKCISCSENNGDTQIKIKSSCFDKPLIINIDNNDNENIEVVQNMINLLVNKKHKKEEPIPMDVDSV